MQTRGRCRLQEAHRARGVLLDRYVGAARGPPPIFGGRLPATIRVLTRPFRSLTSASTLPPGQKNRRNRAEVRPTGTEQGTPIVAAQTVAPDTVERDAHANLGPATGQS